LVRMDGGTLEPPGEGWSRPRSFHYRGVDHCGKSEAAGYGMPARCVARPEELLPWDLRGRAMALPPSRETPRGQYLMDILKGAAEDVTQHWPNPTKEDLALIGSIVVMYNYMDFNLRRFVEILDHENLLPEVWKGKTGRMPIADLENILEAMPEMAASNQIAIQRIREGRKLRNLLAHFAVRRFPKEDAFVFVTKYAPDFKRVLGYEPEPGIVMTSVADGQQLRDLSKMLDGLMQWLATATREIEDEHFRRKGLLKERKLDL
jgi:hypothetical protein